MTRTVFNVILVSSAWLLSLGFGLDIDVSPHKVSELIQDKVDITCKLDNTDGHVKEIMLLELFKDGDRIAVLRPNSQLTIGQGLETRFQAEGKISRSAVLDSFLHVTLSKAELQDSGSYTCLLYYLNQLDLLQETRTSQNLTVSDEDLKYAITYLVNKVSYLETELKVQQTNHKTEISDLETNHKTQIDQVEQQFESRITQLQAELEKQKNDSASQMEKLNKSLDSQNIEFLATEASLHTNITLLINETFDQERQLLHQGQILKDQERQLHEQAISLKSLNNKENTTILFLATQTGTGVFTAGGDFIFNQVLTNEGGGYSGPTGVFTAPVRGIYLFTVSVCAYTSKSIYLDLRTNTGQVLTRLRAYNNDNVDYRESTGMVELDVGQTIRPVIRGVSSGFSLYQYDNPDLMNKFSGLLIKML